MPRKRTTTSNFGVGARESHDASGFYGRFRAPDVTTDDSVTRAPVFDDPFLVGDARDMHHLPDGCTALVVTSPPYFAGKQYEEELERDGIPASYLEYLGMLTEVFAECVRILEPGGRIAVNVANLGRRPYRSLSADVIRILENDLGLLLRGEIIWRKAAGANGNCAWGSFRSPANPVLRDVTERIIVASKGRFDRAMDAKGRAQHNLPHRATLEAEEFMALTLDIWDIPPESAQRVGHPAPFPVELPEQLITLFTYEGDLVVDPFMGSGSTLVAAARTGRRYAGYDLDPDYVERARARVRTEGTAPPPTFAAHPDIADTGVAGQRLIAACLDAAGLRIVRSDVAVRGLGLSVPFEVTTPDGRVIWCEIGGPHRRYRGGLSKSEAVLRALGRSAALRRARGDTPLVVLTTQMPAPRSEAARLLEAGLADTGLIDAVIDVSTPEGRAHLAALADGPDSAQ